MKYILKRLFGKRLPDRPEDCVDGGVRINNCTDAPKVIYSTKPVAFECHLSTVAMVDLAVERSLFKLKARLENGVVSVSYQSYTESKSFTAAPSFMDKLQSIISRFDFAQFNGHNMRVSGLPDMFGAYLSVDYQSGERISASNNQDCFIPPDAIPLLISLFKGEF